MNVWRDIDSTTQRHVRQVIAGAVDDLRERAGYAAISADLGHDVVTESRDRLRARATRMRRIADAFEALVRAADRSDA